MLKKQAWFSFLLLAIVFFGCFVSFSNLKTKAASSDYDLHQKYENYQKYLKYEKYRKYKKYQRAKDKYGFDTPKEKSQAKDAYDKYQLYKKSPSKYPQYAGLYSLYKKYSSYKKNISPLSKYSGYGKYKKYNDDSYEDYSGYGGDEYKQGYDRYEAFIRDLDNVTTDTGPEIRVGLWSKNHLDADKNHDPFRITATKSFTVTNCDSSTVVGTIPTTSTLRVEYIVGGGGDLNIYDDAKKIIPKDPVTGIGINIGTKVCLEAEDGNNADMVFDVNTPDNLSKGEYDQYRGKIKIQHSYSSGDYGNGGLYGSVEFPDHDLEHANRRIWVINILPLEQYLWGYGEMSQGGISGHEKTMIVAARSYARWYIEYANKWGDSPQIESEDGEGFDILSYSSSQIYNGYDYELTHSFIPEAAKDTNGIMMKYGDEYALGAYCSYTDGNTRALNGYPYLVSVSDPYGKHPTYTTQQLIDDGNHMWGLSARGSLNLAQDPYNWNWTKVLNYYYTGINLVKEY